MCVIAYECFGFIWYDIFPNGGEKLISIGSLRINCLECFRFFIGSVLFSFCLFVLIRRDKVKDILSKLKWLQKLGRISYSFYLVHYIIVIKVASMIRKYEIDGLVAVVFTFSLSIMLAYIMYWIIEVRLASLLYKVLKVR